MFAVPPVPTPVAAAHSWYLGDLDRGRLATLARNDETSAFTAGLATVVVVLDAGDPALTPGSTQLPDHRGPATEQAIGAAAAAYAYSWSHQPPPASADTGDRHQQRRDACRRRPRSGLGATGHRGEGGPTRESIVAGGLDDEPDYGPAKETLGWLKGYDAGAVTHPFVDLGDCACTAGQALPTGWTLAQRATVAKTGRVLPQQYRTTGIDAKRWAHLDASTGKHLQFLGVLTETRACDGPPVRECTGIDQSPAAATAGLSKALGRPVANATDIGYLIPPPTVAGLADHHVRDGLLAALLTALVLSGAYTAARRKRLS